MYFTESVIADCRLEDGIGLARELSSEGLYKYNYGRNDITTANAVGQLSTGYLAKLLKAIQKIRGANIVLILEWEFYFEYLLVLK